jgi:hypothetical protein
MVVGKYSVQRIESPVRVPLEKLAKFVLEFLLLLKCNQSIIIPTRNSGELAMPNFWCCHFETEL